MEEALEKDESTASTISIFFCYAHEDEAFLKELEQQLAPLKRLGLITSWHDQDIRAGIEWEQEIHAHLNTAQIILLLVSPSFMSSDYCYSIEMTRALERQSRGESRVIPVIVRPVYWQIEPLKKLQALPTNGKPIASWNNHDEAFFNVAEGIRHVIEDIAKQPSIFPPSSQQREKSDKKLQNTGVLAKAAEVGNLQTKQRFVENISNPKNRNLRHLRLFVSIVILLALALSLIPFIPFPACFAGFCRSSQQPTNHQSSQNGEVVQDQNLSMALVDVVSPSYVLPGDPQSHSTSNVSPKSISAVSLAKNTSTYDKIIVDVKNLRNGGVDILIDYIALKLLSIPVLPRPLRVWTPGVLTTYIAYPYPVIYKGQTPDQLLYAEPPQNVILKPGETDQLSIQVLSTVSAFLQFQVQLFYQIANSNIAPPLTLHQTFQVVFSDASNW